MEEETETLRATPPSRNNRPDLPSTSTDSTDNLSSSPDSGRPSSTDEKHVEPPREEVDVVGRAATEPVSIECTCAESESIWQPRQSLLAFCERDVRSDSLSPNNAVASDPFHSGEDDDTKAAAAAVAASSDGAMVRPDACHRLQPLKKSNGPRVQDCVPDEFTASPIVEILATPEQRPLPPTTIDALNRSLAEMTYRHAPMSATCLMGVSPASSTASSGISSGSASLQHRAPRMGISAASVPSSSSGLPLLELIIRSHPIWYLPQVGRAAANHLLQPMSPGSFVVRASTRPGSMALTVRLPPDADRVTDHFLIERHGPTVKIETSPHVFRSLPLLIEHYCRHGAELKCRLALPVAVEHCNNVTDLQRLSLLGLDFWTSRFSVAAARLSSPAEDLQQSFHSQRQVSQPMLGKQQQSRAFPDPWIRSKPSTTRKQLPTMSSMLSIKKSQSESESLRPDNSNYSPINSVSSKSSSSTGKAGLLKGLFSSQPSTSAAPDPVPPGTIRRSFAKFRNLNRSRSKTKESKDDATCVMPSSDAIRARQAAYRREQTDLNAEIVRRLASHSNTNHSPPRQLQKLLVPPSNPDAMAKCIQELKNRRRTTTASPQPSPGTSAADHRPKKMPDKPKQQSQPKAMMPPQQSEVDGFIQNNGKTVDVILRSKRRQASSPSDRLSVPTLDRPPPSEQQPKFGRAPDTGELQTINEGLITPVVRRRQILVNSPSKRPEGGHRDAYVDGSVLLTPDGFVSFLPAEQQRTKPESVKLPDAKPVAPPRHRNNTTVPSSAGSLSPALLNWTHVNTELKFRQKVATVRPTPQMNKSAPSAALEPPSKKQSEYAQVADVVADLDTSAGSCHSSASLSEAATSGAAVDEDDVLSVAGTVFNEPWDSNAWENLLDLAKYGDEKPSVRAAANAFYSLSDTVLEDDHEDELLDVDDIQVSCVDVDENNRMTPSPVPGKALAVENNRVWAEVSRRIPSEPSSKCSTFDPRKKAASLLNVSTSTNSLSRRPITPMAATEARLRAASGRPPTNDPGSRIQQYVEGLARDPSTVFGATLHRFMECTFEAGECDPQVVIRNVRQFLNGIKNYLIKHGEGELHALIDTESLHLGAHECLNIDAIFEAVLHKILLVPIKAHLYHLLVKAYLKQGALQLLSENVSRVRAMKPSELGFSESTVLPSAKDMEAVKQTLRRMQNHYSPLKKLEHLLRALSIVYLPNNNNNDSSLAQSGAKKLPPAEELIRWLVYILARTSTINCEVEATYMWELLPQQLLTTGDAAYYLTTLFSAVHILKHPDSIRRLGKGYEGISPCPGPAAALSKGPSDAFLSVAIPDEQSGLIEYHTFPAVPQMNASKLCRVIAHQSAITNPEDYGLYVLSNGFESCLLPTDCPDAVRDQLMGSGRPYLFAYKRHDAKIAWPKHIFATPASSTASSLPSAFQQRPVHLIQPSPIHRRRHFPVAAAAAEAAQ